MRTSVRSSSLAASIMQIGCVAHRPAQRRVTDVGRREPVVDPRRRRVVDVGLHRVDERGDVVIGDPLPFEDPIDERLVGRRRLCTADLRSLLWHHADRGVALGREQFDFEPPAEADRVGPHRVHLRRGVARDHSDTQTR